MMDGRKASAESLLTRKSLALSLAAPRVPPHGTAHRALLIGGDPTLLPWTPHHAQDNHNNGSNHNQKDETTADKNISSMVEDSLRRRLVAFLRSSAVAMKRRPRMPHPHLPTGPEGLAEHVTRSISVWCPLPWQNWLRDSGHLRSFIDRAMMSAAPTYALACPGAYHEFRRLSALCQKIRYGSHPSQMIDLFLPKDETAARGLVFFVHGGAWGSGTPWLYRLVASPFLRKGIAVAVVGYRTYPCGTVLNQVQDLELASEELALRYPKLCQQPTELGVCVMGHSSGAHISFLMMAEWTRRRMAVLEETLQKKGGAKITSSMTAQASPLTGGMRIDSFVGISGPYNVSHHFDYEASRGLEEISPLKPACGYSREEFRKLSPALKIVDCMSEWSSECEKRALDNVIPNMVLIHGIEDDVVPFTSTADAASLLKSCGVTKLKEIYLAKTGHNECAMQIMMGGKVQDIIMDCIQNVPKEREAQANMIINSRL